MTCNLHSNKTGKRCSKDAYHADRHFFDLTCICGGTYCAGKSLRVFRSVIKKVGTK